MIHRKRCRPNGKGHFLRRKLGGERGERDHFDEYWQISEIQEEVLRGRLGMARLRKCLRMRNSKSTCRITNIAGPDVLLYVSNRLLLSSPLHRSPSLPHNFSKTLLTSCPRWIFQAMYTHFLHSLLLKTPSDVAGSCYLYQGLWPGRQSQGEDRDRRRKVCACVCVHLSCMRYL